MENGIYLFGAYALVWAAVFGFIAMLIARQKTLNREIKSLEASLKEDDLLE